MLYSKIIGIGSYLPEKILSNAELEKIVDTSDEWIVERTGIRERRLAADNETASTLSVKAAQEALKDANLNPENIDMILVATCTSDRFFPSTACLVQEQLGIEKNIPSFDVTAACSGFVYAVTIADQFIKSGTHKNILVIGSEVLSRGIDWSDRSTCVLFGDGAGAILLQGSEEPGIISSDLYGQGKHKDILSLRNLSTAPAQPGEDVTQYLAMNGREVFRLASTFVEKAIVDTLKKNELTIEDIDWIIPHQANERILLAIAKKLGVSIDKFISTIGMHGNTSAASIPLALEHARRDGRVQPGQLLLLEGFGGGMTWGSILVRL